MKPQTWVDWAARKGLESLSVIQDPRGQGLPRVSRALQSLQENLALVKDYQDWNPKVAHEVALKRNYRIVDEIRIGDDVNVLYPIKDGRIFVASDNCTVSIWSKGEDGNWTELMIAAMHDRIGDMQVGVDGTLFVISAGVISVFQELSLGRWSRSDVSGRKDKGRVHISPDKQLFSVGTAGRVESWSVEKGKFIADKELRLSNMRLHDMQVLPNGDILVCGDNGLLAIIPENNDESKIEVSDQVNGRSIFHWCRMFSHGLIATISGNSRLQVYSRDAERNQRAFTPDDKGLLQVDCSIATWNVSEFTTAVKAQCLQDGRIITLDEESRLRVWHLEPASGAIETPKWMQEMYFRYDSGSKEVFQWVSEDLLTAPPGVYAAPDTTTDANFVSNNGDKVLDFRATIDGRIILSMNNGKIYIYEGETA